MPGSTRLKRAESCVPQESPGSCEGASHGGSQAGMGRVWGVLLADLTPKDQQDSARLPTSRVGNSCTHGPASSALAAWPWERRWVPAGAPTAITLTLAQAAPARVLAWTPTRAHARPRSHPHARAHSCPHSHPLVSRRTHSPVQPQGPVTLPCTPHPRHRHGSELD